MRCLLSCVFLILLFQTSLAQEHKNETKGFALTPAEGWIVKADPEAFGKNLEVRAAKDDPYAPSVQVMVWPGEPSISDYFENQQVTLEGTADGVLELEETELAGQKAGSFTYTMNKALKTRTIYVIANGNTYVVSQTARIKNFDDQKTAFEQMVGSFRLLD